MQLERALASLAACDLAREPAGPPLRDRVEAKPGRRRDHAPPRRLDECAPLGTGEVEVVADGSKVWLAVEHEADGVLAVGLAVDAAFDAHASASVMLLK